MFTPDFVVDESEISDVDSPLVVFPEARHTPRRGTKPSSFKSPRTKRIHVPKVGIYDNLYRYRYINYASHWLSLCSYNYDSILSVVWTDHTWPEPVQRHLFWCPIP